MRHPRFGGPEKVIAAALAELARCASLRAAAPTLRSAPLGHSRRRYANTAAVIECALAPVELLAKLQAIEARFGRRRRGRAWSARVLDLDLILWDGGCHACGDLTLPHPHFRTRGFVLGPARRIAGTWRDPLTRLTLRQLAARLDRPRPRP